MGTDIDQTRAKSREDITTDDLPPITSPTRCAYCCEDFPSRSALFRHLRLEDDKCPAPRDDTGEKIMIVFGYRSSLLAPADEEIDLTANSAPVLGGDGAGDMILRAMKIIGEDGTVGGTKLGDGAKPAGYSQASAISSRRCPCLAQEPGVSAT